MTAFPEWPVVQNLKAHLWRLVEDYIYEWTSEERRLRITVFRNFVFDYASVPSRTRLLWLLVDRLDPGPAALLHDWLYQWQGALPAGSLEVWVPASASWVEVRAQWTRQESDRLMGRIMRESGVPKWRRRMVYRAVRVFGRGAWRSIDTPWNEAD